MKPTKTSPSTYITQISSWSTGSGFRPWVQIWTSHFFFFFIIFFFLLMVLGFELRDSCSLGKRSTVMWPCLSFIYLWMSIIIKPVLHGDWRIKLDNGCKAHILVAWCM
jgi:hypothetical protein